jgi:hypothetical protein
LSDVHINNPCTLLKILVLSVVLISNKLEQFKFKLETFLGVSKHAGKALSPTGYKKGQGTF